MSAPARSVLALLHYWWPLVVGWSSTLVIHRATLRTPDPAGVAMLLCGIGAAYSLDRVLDAPRTLQPWARRLLAAVTAVCAIAGARILWELPLTTAVIVPVMSLVAIAYRPLKRLPLAKNVFVPLVWTWGAIALPFPDGSWFGWRWIDEPVAAPLFLLFAAGVLLCDVRDEPSDRPCGVASIAVLCGGRATARVGIVLAVGAACVAQAEQRLGLALSAIGLSLTALRPQLLATDLVGPLLVDVFLSMPGRLIAWHLV